MSPLSFIEIALTEHSPNSETTPTAPVREPEPASAPIHEPEPGLVPLSDPEPPDQEPNPDPEPDENPPQKTAQIA